MFVLFNTRQSGKRAVMSAEISDDQPSSISNEGRALPDKKGGTHLMRP